MTELPDIGDSFKDLVWDAVIAYAVKGLITLVPFLSFGPFSMIIGVVVSIIGNFIYDAIKQFVNFEATIFKNQQHKAEYADAVIKLKLIARDKGINSPEFQVARDANKKALSNLAKYSS